MMSRGPFAGLLGRRDECRALDDLLAGARSGRSGVLVLRGEAGIGKTELLNYVFEHATGCRIVRAAGAQSEMELSYAGLHQLCAPLLGGIDNLPEPQRDALCTAFGLRGGDAPDRFLVGLATLSLLAEAGGDQPLVCLIDDAQWLDRVSAQTLEFVARRLLAESVVLLFAVREATACEPAAGLTDLPDLPVTGLTESDSRDLLDSVVTGPLDHRVRSRIVAETRGNPLALLELPRGLAPVDLLTDGFVRTDARPLSSQIEQGFLRRVRALPDGTQRLLFTAAAEPVGDVTLLRRAAARLGIVLDAAVEHAEASGLITFGTLVRFRHPLVRSAAYRAAGPDGRREVHRALADATDAELDPDRRAWHLARATAGPDETVAAELERSADRAQARGGIAAAAAFLDRAAELTPDPARRGARALAAAHAKYQAGAYDAARELADAAELGPLDELGAAQSTLLRGQIMSASKSASAGLPLLLEAAKRLESLDARRARETYRDAIYAALTAGRLPKGGILTVAKAILSAPMPAEPTRDDLLLAGLARVTTEGYAAGTPMLLEALVAFRTDEVSREEGLGWLPLACRLAHSTWDFESWSVLSAGLVDLARETGTLSVLPSALLLRLSNRVFAGNLVGADSLVVEATAIGEATGSRFFAHYGALVVEPWKGREPETQQAIKAITQDLLLRGEGKVVTATQWAAAVLYNGLGRYEEAYAAAKRGCENPQELGLYLQSMVELVEASGRLGKPEDATEAVRTIHDMAQASGTDWALGTSAMVRALVSDGQAADALYREAIERLGNTEVRTEFARVQLLYGEWLRRGNRRADARAHLAAAYDMLSQIGAEAFAERARRELQATGAKVRKRTAATHETLTPQEAQIARLAGEGLTNPEIGAQLFISPHTVEWHLRKVFSKLGISSRREIRTMQLEGEATSA
ncbi:AAA family ATPase [Streptomyces sp. NPDC006332]|uniref:helix-turn-helix transcriptional regulator n=1 Tax=Streptomyces sp. NPDC006332 TaxID=3155456 RepID=UPI0033BC3776